MSVPRIVLRTVMDEAHREPGPQLDTNFASMTIEEAFRIAPLLAHWQRILRIYEGQAEALIRISHAEEAKERTR